MLAPGTTAATGATAEKDGVNPSSPEKGVMLASGTLSIPAGYTYKQILIKYRKKGANVWLDKAVAAPKKDTPEQWAYEQKDIASGVYEVHVVLEVTTSTGMTGSVACPDVRTVEIK